MSELKLISVDVLYNCGEPGDYIYITAKWQNCAEQPQFNAKIAADFIFCGKQRRDETQIDNFRLLWTPFPNTYHWKKGDIWTTTGTWKIPETWGGSFALNLSLIGDKGETIEFYGKNNKKTYFEYITEIDIAWGFGRNRMLEQRKASTIKINSESVFEETHSKECVNLNEFKFNKKYPSICGYKNSSWIDFEPILKVRKISDNSIYTFIGNLETVYNIFINRNSIKYSALNRFCAFDILIEFKDSFLEIVIENISEKNDYEMISFELPSLVQMSADSTIFTNFYGGGRRVRLKDALMQTADFYYDTCNLISVASDEGSFCVEAEDVENILRQSVIKNSFCNKAVCLGAVIRKHIPANKSKMKSIPVELKALKIWYTDKNNWKISGNIIQKRLMEDYPKLYKDTLMYKIMLDASGQYTEENPSKLIFSKITTLSDVKKMIMKMYHLSYGMRQVVYLIGWQKGGHDFCYPYPHKLQFNPNCGTLAEFNSLREELKAYNVELSLHDNFDDAYLSDEYVINDNIICIDECGNPWKGWMWAGGMSYILDPKAYITSGEMQERVDCMITDYGIKDSYHLDVLTSEVRRYNFKQNSLMSAEDGIKYKKEILEAFNKKGIDVTSETLALPFVGKIGYAQNTRYRFKDSLFYADEIVPLTTIGFHGITPYKVGANGSCESILRSIALGAACCIETETETNVLVNSRNLYLSSIPMSKLAYKRVTNSEIKKDKWEFIYEDSKVMVDFKTGNYCIEFEGKVISENYTTFMQLYEDTYCYYSINSGEIRPEFPLMWKNVVVHELNENGITTSFQLNQSTGSAFFAKADTPYIFKKEV